MQVLMKESDWLKHCGLWPLQSLDNQFDDNKYKTPLSVYLLFKFCFLTPTCFFHNTKHALYKRLISYSHISIYQIIYKPLISLVVMAYPSCQFTFNVAFIVIKPKTPFVLSPNLFCHQIPPLRKDTFCTRGRGKKLKSKN